MGRASKYRDGYCDLVREHCAKGFSFTSFAGLVRVSRDSIYQWVEDHPEFAEAKAEALELSRIFWEKLAVVHIINTKESTLNSAVWIYNMKCRFSDEWLDKTESTQKTKLEISTQDAAEIVDMAKRTSEHLAKKKK
jgi:hypothetical protein